MWMLAFLEKRTGLMYAVAKSAIECVPTHRLEYGWEKALAQRASELHQLASDRTAFVETIRGIVLRTRSIGNLPIGIQTLSSAKQYAWRGQGQA
jgi:hypothetical protein